MVPSLPRHPHFLPANHTENRPRLALVKTRSDRFDPRCAHSHPGVRARFRFPPWVRCDGRAGSAHLMLPSVLPSVSVVVPDLHTGARAIGSIGGAGYHRYMADATGPTGATGPVGHYGFTGPDYIGPTGIPGAGATGATGAGTAAVLPSANPWAPRLNDGLHAEGNVAYFKSLDVDAIRFMNVDHHSHHPAALEAVVALLAICALLRAGITAIHHVIDLLLRLRFT